jgi:hypothetical protein
MIALFFGFLTCLGTLFRSRHSLGIEILLCASNWEYLSGRIHILACGFQIECFGFCFADYGLAGQAFSRLFVWGQSELPVKPTVFSKAFT